MVIINVFSALGLLATHYDIHKRNQHFKLSNGPPKVPLIQEISLQHLDKKIYNSNLGLFLY